MNPFAILLGIFGAGGLLGLSSREDSDENLPRGRRSDDARDTDVPTGSEPVTEPEEPASSGDPEPEPAPVAAPVPQSNTPNDPEPAPTTAPEPELDVEPEEPTSPTVPEPTPAPIAEPAPGPQPAPSPDVSGNMIASASFFVAANGNDNGTGSIDDPFATIGHAASQADPGDVILVRGGDYEGPVWIDDGGAPGNNLIIAAYPGERPVIDGSNTAYDTDLVTIAADNVRFEGFEIVNASGTGLAVWSAQNVTLADNIVHATESGGIWVGTDQLGESGGHVITGNIVYDTGLMNEERVLDEGWPRGIAVDVSTDVVVEDNVVFKNYGEGIGILSSSDVAIDGNSVYDNFSVQIYLDNAQDVTATDNLIFHTGDEEYFRKDEPGIGMLIANEYTQFEQPTSGIDVRDNIFGDVEPVFYDDSYGWGGGIEDSNLGPNTTIAFEEIDPDWEYSEDLLF